MSGLQLRNGAEDSTSAVDVREQGNSLRVAANTPHLVSLGCGRLSTAVTIHPIKQGRVTIGTDSRSDILLQGTGVQLEHCRIENSNGVVTLYPVNGVTIVDGLLVDQPVRLSQGCMIGIGRSNYLRFNHPAEANLMKSVLPNTRISMAPMHFVPGDNNYQQRVDVNNQQLYNSEHHRNNDPRLNGQGVMPTGSENPQNGQYYEQNDNHQNNYSQNDGHQNLEKELDMTYKELSKKKPPVAPRKMLREYDQVSNSSNSDQEVLMNQRANTPPKSGGIMSKVSKFEYYVRNSQKNSKNPPPVQNDQCGEMFSPKVFSSNSLTVNTPAKDVLGKEVPSNYVQNKNQNVANGDYRNLRKIVLNENNGVEARNCSYTNVTMKNPVAKIEHIAKNYSDPYYSDVPDDVTPSTVPNGHASKAAFKLKPPSASFNRNPVFNNTNFANSRLASSPPNTHNSEAEAQRRQAHIARMDDESQKFLEQARLEEILNICAEYEKQITQGVPTTPTEKRPPNKIITNGSLPRGLQNSPNVVQSSDGYFRFDPGHNRNDCSPIRIHPPSSPHSPLVLQSRHHKPELPNYENVKIFTPTNMSTATNGQYTQMNRANQTTMSPVDSKNVQFSSHHSSYENFNPESQTVTVHRQENHVQNARQFPITELSSPVMIRKIARNAQNSSNYAGSYERNTRNGDMPSTRDNSMNFMSSNSTISPYENMVIQSRNVNAAGAPYLNVTPKSPSSHSPRTRIKTTYSHKNPTNPQHFVFPSPPPIEQLEDYQLDASLKALSIATNELSKQCQENAKCSGIEKQLSLTEDIPMIDDTDFANELEMRIARLKPENRNHSMEPTEQETLLDPDNIFGGNRRNFEEIRRDLIADIPELDEIHRDIDRDLLQAVTPTEKSIGASEKSSTNEYLQEMSQKLRDVPLVDEVFCENGTQEYSNRESYVSDPQTPVEVKLIKTTVPNKSLEDNVSTLEILRCKRKKVLAEIHQVKCKMSDIRSQEDDILRELELEKALLQGEYESEMAILKLEQQRLTGLRCEAQTFEGKMSDQKSKQEERHETANQRLQEAAKGVSKMEKDFSRHIATLEELRNAQESLENERKTFEDMEFQDLEEEAENLAHREELQNEITALTQKIDAQKSRILNLRIETSNNLNSAVEETKALQADYVNMLNIIEKLTIDLQIIEMEIKTAVSEIGVDYRQVDSKRNSSMEERRSRIKSGDFSPPSSDNEDMNEFECFENRKKTLKDRLVSIDQMSRSMIVDLGEKRSIEDLITSDHDRSLQSIENSPNKVMRESSSKESSPVRNNDQGSEQYESSPTEIETSSPNRIDNSVSSEGSREKSPMKTDYGPDLSPDKEKKQGFWERNFDSLSRLKGKEKKSKAHTKSQDIMSQSLNENMFFNNEKIESEYGSFEKCNSLRSSKKNKDSSNGSKSAEKSSKIPSFATLGKIIRRDSVGKKSKDEKTMKNSSEVISNKENIDLNTSINSEADEKDGFKSEGSPDQEQKNIKHRYVKNAKSTLSDNKYLSKCTKTNQQSISIPPDQNHSNIVDDFRRMSGNSFNGDPRDSYADSLEEEVRIIDPTTGNTVRLCEITKSSDVKKISYRKSAGDEGRRFSGDIFSGLCENTKVPSQDDIDRMSKVTLDAPILSKTGEMNSLGRKTLDSLMEIERNRMAMLEQKGCQVMEDEREKISELKKRVQTETKLKWEEEQRSARNESATQLDTKTNEHERDSKNMERSLLDKIDEDDGVGEREVQDISQEGMDSMTGNEAESSSIFGDSTQDSTSLEKQLRHSQTDSYNSSGGCIEENRVPPISHLPPTTPNSRPLSQLSDMSSDGASPYLMEGPRRSRKVSGSSLGPRPREDFQRPLTRYLPIDTDDLNLRMHIETAGHQVDLCPHIHIDSVSCRGYLHKLGAKFHGWSKRWFVFDRSNKTFIYYSDKNEKKPRGGAYFQVIEEVYLDHLNASKSPTPLTTFVVKTRQRKYYLTAPSGPAARIWIDVIFTGAQGYTEYMH